MAITQRFYPKFFMNAMLDNLTAGGSLAGGVTVPCTAYLHTAANGAWDVTDNTTADLTAVTTQSDGVTSLTNPTLTVTVTLDAANTQIKFSVTSMQWTNPNTFRYVTIATTTGNYLMMNLDIGTSVSSGGTVTLTMTAGQEPALQFTT